MELNELLNMSKYIKDFVTGYGITFKTHSKNYEAFEKAQTKWKEISSDLQVGLNEGPLVYLFCGAKNNGKSSLVRYLVNDFNGNETIMTHNKTTCDNQQQKQPTTKRRNSNLKSCDRYAYYIDLDCGQPEMTTPGVVSAHIIRPDAAPLTSPPYMNLFQHELVSMSCVGGLNMSVNPRTYIENCRLLLNHVKKHNELNGNKNPIFINTMGFIRGLGLAMLLDLIKLSSPSHLVVLNVADNPNRTVYVDFDPQVVDKTRASFFHEAKDSAQKLDYECHIHNLEFSFVESTSVSTKNRTSLQIGYFSSMPESLLKPVMQLQPKFVSLKNVSLHCVSSYPLKSNLVLEILPQSWVHLVKLRKTSSNSPPNGLKHENNTDGQNNHNEEVCKMVDDISGNLMLGCGIVTEIDLNNARISIVTPLDQAMIEREVDCIVKPLSIQVPREFLLPVV